MIIYKTTNLVNNRFYIGKDKHNNPSYMGSGKLLQQAISKYGLDNFKKEILETCTTESELNKREIHWIGKLRNSACYNIANGGEGGDTFTNNPRNEEIRELHRQNAINDNPMDRDGVRQHHVEIVQSELYKQNMSITSMRIMSDQSVRDKISSTLKKYINTPENLKRWSECKRGSKNGNWLGYIKITKSNGEIMMFESAVEVGNQLHCDSHTIRTHCRNNTTYVRGPYKGWKFEFSASCSIE